MTLSTFSAGGGVWFFLLLFLAGTFILTAFSSAFRRIIGRHNHRNQKELNRHFFYRPLHQKLIPGDEEEGIFFATIAALSLSRFIFFLLAAVLFLSYLPESTLSGWAIGLSVGTLLLLVLLLVDYLPRILGVMAPRPAYTYLAPSASLFLLIAMPITWVFMRISSLFFRTAAFHKMHEPLAEAKQEIFDILQQSELEDKLEPEDKKLIESVVDFRDLIVREVMVPRIDVFSLPGETPVKDAARLVEEQGYSRTPVYKGTIDELKGILMYKDILNVYMEASEKNDPSLLNRPIEEIVKPALFTPETKKISHLLQEFRKRQMHLAIVVDEYGGTEGIITIEDILESLVGEIEDEYDDEKDLYISLPDGSHIVDAKISLLDLEEFLGITLPEEGDFDTLGGYIFHKAGEIPKKGFKIKLDTIQLEVLRVSDRAIEKIKIRERSS